MHLINSHLFQDTPSGNDVLFDLLVDKATTLGYTLPSANTLSALNTLIKDMRRIGMIQRLDLFHVYASDLGADSQFRLMNICNAEMIGTVGGGTTGVINWSNEGCKPNFTGTFDTRAWINTNYFPNVGGHNYSQNNASMGAVIYDNSSAYHRIMGLSNDTTNTTVRALITASNSFVQRINSNVNLDSIAYLTGNGLTILNRLNASNVQTIKIHEMLNFTSVSYPITNAQLRIHNSTNISTNINFENYYGADGVSCAFAGASIPYDMAQNFRQIYNKYLRTIGLQQVA